MSTVLGRWALTMRTPIGSIDAQMTFADEGGGLTGTAAGKHETVALRDVRVSRQGEVEHLTWSQAITKPMRLNLDFDVLVEGDRMQGTSRAGRLPRSTVTGHRVLE